MLRILNVFLWAILVIGLTSCGHKEIPETIPVPPLPKVKPVPQVAAPPPVPIKPLIHKVGILLPLTGPQANLGKAMLEATELALFETGTSSVILLPQDTAQGAHQAALNSLNEGAELLLGPIFASEVEDIKPLLSARNVNLICFSTDPAIAGNGTFILGFLPAQQIERVILFAKERGISKIAALTPEGQYGSLIDHTLKRLHSQGTIQLLGITHYAKGDILEGNPGNIRLLEDIVAYKRKGLEALIIPEGGENLEHLTFLLSSQRPLKILGTGQWDAPQTFRSAEVLEGGFFASTDPHARENFEARFQKTYGYIPPRIGTLAYDATALAAALADKGYSLQNLTFSQGFSGVDGLFRLTPQGLNERGLAVFQVGLTKFKIVSPAPRTF